MGYDIKTQSLTTKKGEHEETRSDKSVRETSNNPSPGLRYIYLLCRIWWRYFPLNKDSLDSIIQSHSCPPHPME